MIRSQHGIEIPSTLAEWCDPERMALVVYDMQVGICRQVAGSDVIVERVGQALEAARTCGMRVAFTRHLSLPRRWMGMVQLRMAMAWQRSADPEAVQPWFLPDAEATQIIPALAPREDEVVFDKITMSAFDSTALPLALRDCGVRAIALAGIAMEIGIEPTARQACDNGFVSVVLGDACGGGDAEARERSLATLAFTGDTIVTDTRSFCSTLRR
jgi:nicotinamidase-related amidase